MTDTFYIPPVQADTRSKKINAERKRRLLLAQEEKQAYNAASAKHEVEFSFKVGDTYTFEVGQYRDEIEVRILRRSGSCIFFRHPVTGEIVHRKVKTQKAKIAGDLAIRTDNVFGFVATQKPYEYVEACDMKCEALDRLARLDWYGRIDRAIEEGVKFEKTLPAAGIYDND